MFPFPNCNFFLSDHKELLLSIFCVKKGEDVYSGENEKLTHLVSLQSNTAFSSVKFYLRILKASIFIFTYLLWKLKSFFFFLHLEIILPDMLLLKKSFKNFFLSLKYFMSCLFRDNRKGLKAIRNSCFKGSVGRWMNKKLHLWEKLETIAPYFIPFPKYSFHSLFMRHKYPFASPAWFSTMN